MPTRFYLHIKKFTNISEEAYSDVLSFCSLQQVAKKDNLLTEGQLCRYQYFVLSGCLRKYFINEKGTEQTTEFAIENWWITDLIAFEHQQSSSFYIQAVENTELLRIDHASLEKLLVQFPGMEGYFRCIYQRAYAAAQMRIRYLYGLSREESYHHFQHHFPDFVQRIPQYLLASYLGFTPEYLSEIRKRYRS